MENKTMKDSVRKVIYWSVYIVLLLGGLYLKIKNAISVENTTIFLFGLMWIWMSVSLLFQINPYYTQKYERKHQVLFAISSLGMGISWSIVSLTQFSNQAMPMILISIPFLIFDAFIFRRYRK